MSTNILIIEDDVNLRQFLKEALEGEGYQVALATNGDEGIKAIQTIAPDLILTDLIMPERDGIEVLCSLRTVQSAPPIIAMSGGWRNWDDNLTLASLLGAKAVLHKPFTLDKLITTLRTVLDEHHATRN